MPETEQDPTSDWMTVKEAAKMLGGVSAKLIYKLYHRGELLGAKIAGTVRLRAASVQQYLAAHSNEKPEAFTPSPPPSSPKTIRKRKRVSRRTSDTYVFLPPKSSRP